MEEWFFFNGISIDGARVAIGQTIQLAVQVDFGTADTAISSSKHTMIGTNPTDNLMIFQFFIEKAFAGIFSRPFRCVASEYLTADVHADGGLAKSPLKNA
jgi:hypothetical protein